ncbi:hypothetical protein [Azotobacter beijerinckii]|uniref:hypothetical protein n=1 Tax=Azotobacter beijerinckii TaxID=170623 RepID=UPI002954E8BD|nr:hypothetical protein [Azotobacter beijerinckii]MDV7211281.1 hypothetical protein [Azotobacter beijerinckii]
MQIISRIPQPFGTTFGDARDWFIAMRDANLLFHLEDDPADIVHIGSGERLFTDAEVVELRAILDRFLAARGERVCEAGYPVFMEALGLNLFAGVDTAMSSSGARLGVELQ